MADPEWAEFEQSGGTTTIRPRSDFSVDFASDQFAAIGAKLNIDFVSGISYRIGDIVYNDSDGLVYRCIKETDSVLPDYTNATSSLYWIWFAGSIGGFVSGRGWWTKFANGTLICSQIFAAATTRTWTYPMEFYEAPVVVPGAIVASSGTGGRWCDKHTVTTTSCVIRGHSDNANLASIAADAIAIGRWKA